jgi:adenylate kinase family enzyme
MGDTAYFDATRHMLAMSQRGATQRIMIVGPAGSGKSTLARNLGAVLDLPVIHLDAHYWLPGWVAPPLDVWRERVRQLVRAETWILDGNYSDTFDLRLAVADTIFFLDIPRHICLGRVIVRMLRSFGRVRSDVAPGCRERLDGAFLRWVWTYPSQRRPAMVRRLEDVEGHLQVIWLRNASEVRTLLRTLSAERVHSNTSMTSSN